METWDLLFIAFIDLNETAGSGSSVRPKKMLQAFYDLGLRVKVLDGWNNQRAVRKKKVRAVFDWLAENRPRFCYIEPPAGPIFQGVDRKLIRHLHREGIPMGLFYRDCYWMFPQTYEDSLTIASRGIVARSKLWLIQQMHRRDLRLFLHALDCFFVPSAAMAEEMHLQAHWVALPPGCDVPAGAPEKSSLPDGALRLLFVGSISNDMGTDFLLRVMAQAAQRRLPVKLHLVCPKAQWESSPYREKYGASPWLELHHVRMGEGLEEVYAQADVCVIPRKPTRYNDFAMPIKLFESLSMGKPVLTTPCKEVAAFVEAHRAGWVEPYEEEKMVDRLACLLAHPEEVAVKTEQAIEAAKNNTWQRRAERVMTELSALEAAKGSKK